MTRSLAAFLAALAVVTIAPFGTQQAFADEAELTASQKRQQESQRRRDLLAKARERALEQGGTVEGQEPPSVSSSAATAEQSKIEANDKKIQEQNAARKAESDTLRRSVQSTTDKYEETSKPKFKFELPAPKAPAPKQEAPAPPPAAAPSPPPQPPAPATPQQPPPPTPAAPKPAPALPKPSLPSPPPLPQPSAIKGKPQEPAKKADAPKPSVASAKQQAPAKKGRGKPKGPLPMTLVQLLLLAAFGGIGYAATAQAEATAKALQAAADALEAGYNAIEARVAKFAGKPSEMVTASPQGPRQPSGKDATDV